MTGRLAEPLRTSEGYVKLASQPIKMRPRCYLAEVEPAELQFAGLAKTACIDLAFSDIDL